MFSHRIVFFFLLLSFLGKAQGYYHSPNDTLWASTGLDQQVTMNITQVHTSNDTLQFVWKKVLVDLPLDWDATICDNSNCNLALIDGDTTLPVLPGDNGLLLIHCTPHSSTGTGVIQYAMYEVQNPQLSDTLTWIIVANELSISENISEFGTFLLKNDCLFWVGENLVKPSLFIVSMDGKRFDLTYDSLSKKIDLPILTSGVYWLFLHDQGRNYYQKIYYGKNE